MRARALVKPALIMRAAFERCLSWFLCVRVWGGRRVWHVMSELESAALANWTG